MSKKKSTFSGSGDDGWGSQERAPSDMDLDITPMIDVTFLLLIFFMVSSTMQASADLDIPPAKHGVGQDSEIATTLIVQGQADSGEDPVIFQENGKQLSMEELPTVIQQAAELGKTHVIIAADGRVKHGFVHKLRKAISSIEGVSSSFKVRDKK